MAKRTILSPKEVKGFEFLRDMLRGPLTPERREAWFEKNKSYFVVCGGGFHNDAPDYKKTYANFTSTYARTEMRHAGFSLRSEDPDINHDRFQMFFLLEQLEIYTVDSSPGASPAFRPGYNSDQIRAVRDLLKDYAEELVPERAEAADTAKLAKLYEFFKRVENAGLLPTLEPILSAKARVFPSRTLKLYEYWKENLSQSAPEEIKIIEVDQPIATPGEADTLLPAITETTSGHSRALSAQNRLDTALQILADDMGIPRSSITVIRERYAQNDQGQSKFPQSLVIVAPTPKHPDVRPLQIFVSDHQYTYVMREPTPYVEGTQLTLSDLRSLETVWMLPYHTPDQWKERLIRYAQTPLTELPVQRKHLVSWADKAHMTLASAFAYRAAHPQSPHPALERDKLIEHGPLSEVVDATWAKANDALNRDSMPLMRDLDIHSVPQLFRKVSEIAPSSQSVERVRRFLRSCLNTHLIVSEDNISQLSKLGMRIERKTPQDAVLEIIGLRAIQDEPLTPQDPDFWIDLQLGMGLLRRGDEGALEIVPEV